MNPDHQRVLGELRDFRSGQRAVEGAVVASTDGILIVHDLAGSETYGIEPSGVAALAAVHLGISRRITDTASHGTLVETVIRGTFGQVVTFPAGPQALVSVIMRSGYDTADLVGVCVDARHLAARVGDILSTSDVAPI